ncbi:MAG TPA: hypothetical protein VGH38_08075 [Bryobacteraceae bacterium]|jgi:hypothetical protein
MIRPRLKRILIAVVVLVVVIAWWMDRRHPFPPHLRNQASAASITLA